MINNAIFSPCRRYRYALWRNWDNKLPTICFIGLNPSKADEQRNDPTINRCIRFAKRLGFGGMSMTNLFALCTSDPNELRHAKHPIGENNDSWIETLCFDADISVAAWGNLGELHNRSKLVSQLIPNLYCLEINKNGSPSHPLYLPRKNSLKPFTFGTSIKSPEHPTNETISPPLRNQM